MPSDDQLTLVDNPEPPSPLDHDIAQPANPDPPADVSVSQPSQFPNLSSTTSSFAPSWLYPDQYDGIHSFTRPDLSSRVTLHHLISSILLTESHTPADCVDLLTDCMEQARSLGIPFSSLLQQEMEPIGVIPLVFEILRCDHLNEPELLEFLVEHTYSERLEWYIQKGCLSRTDNGNELYQFLRSLIPPNDDRRPVPNYQVLVNTRDSGFNAVVCISHFTTHLAHAIIASSDEAQFPAEQRRFVPTDDPTLDVKWIALGRVWVLHVGSNSLELALQEGELAHVDASLTIIGEGLANTMQATTLSLPKLCLSPLSQSGTHSTVLRPCFDSSSDAEGPSNLEECTPHSDEFLFELRVDLEFSTNSETKTLVEEEDWDDLYEDNPVGTDSGWVKASWSGRDEDI